MHEDRLLEKFEKEVLIFMDDLYRMAARFASLPEEAEDLTQETFLRAFNAYCKGTRIRNPKAYLFRTLKNIIIDSMKGNLNKEHVSIDDVSQEIPDPGGFNPEDALLMKSAKGRLQRALQEMPPEYRLALLLRDYEGLSYAEISAIMECPVGTVRSRINRARITLKKAIFEKEHKKARGA